MKKLFDYLIRTYTEYLGKAKTRVAAGAANVIETLTIESERNEYQLAAKQNELEINALEQQLQFLLQSEEPVTASDSLFVLSFQPEAGVNTIFIQLATQNIQRQKALIPVLEAARKPDFHIGYAAQKYYEGGWMSGVEAGISLPLFNANSKRKVAAQKIAVEAAKAKLEEERLSIKQRLLEIQTAIRLYAEGIDYYRRQLDIINPEIERVSRLNYQAGEITYLELLNTLNLLAKNNKSYREQVLAYNQAVILYQYFITQD